MNEDEKNRLIEICEAISENTKKDAENFDGQPLTGKVVAEYFGYQGAAIKALSEILIKILKNEKTN